MSSNIQEEQEEKQVSNDESTVSSSSMDESFHGKHSLRFHLISGKNVRFSNHNRLAERKERTFCDAIVFSQRPVAVHERVTLRLVKQSSDWNGIFKFGNNGRKCSEYIHSDSKRFYRFSA